MTALNRDAVDGALRNLLAHLDYDMHKYLECGEEDGEDHYDEVVDDFITAYEYELTKETTCSE